MTKKRGVEPPIDPSQEKLAAAKADVEKARQQMQSLILKNKEALANLKALFEEAKRERAARDEENLKVKELKVQKNQIEERATILHEKLGLVERKLDALPKIESPVVLKEKIERLEWIQQTEATTVEERQLAKQIQELKTAMPKAQALADAFAERNALREDLRKTNAEAKALREELHQHAQKSEQHHAAHTHAFKKAASLQEKLAEAFKELDEKRALLKSERDEFLEVHNVLREEERKEQEKERTERQAILERQKQKISQNALRALARFKTGEKLSLEDLQAIQEAGLA